MKKLTLTLAAAALAISAISGPAIATPTPTDRSAHTSAEPALASAEGALAAQLAKEPGAVRGNEIHYPDGRVFVAVDAGTLSISQCSAGRFCLWSFTNYSGSFIYKTGQGVTHAISTSVGSFYNNRARGARLYSNTGASSACYAPGVMQPSVSASYNSAQKVYLSATTTC